MLSSSNVVWGKNDISSVTKDVADDNWSGGGDNNGANVDGKIAEEEINVGDDLKEATDVDVRVSFLENGIWRLEVENASCDGGELNEGDESDDDDDGTT